MTARADLPGVGAGRGFRGARPAAEVLTWSRRLVDPALRDAVATLPESMRRIAGYHFGWWEADGCPTAKPGACAAVRFAGLRSGPGQGARTAAGSGKAIRPALALLAAEAVGATPGAAMPAAVAVELVHNFSLIQDDVIDGDLTRRHRPTVWSVFGTGAAIVAADALLALAFDALPASRHRLADDGVRMLRNAVLALADGQHADISFEERADVDLAECVTMVEAKCGALLGCACALGARLAGAAPAQVSRLHAFGVQVGVAFQITDDLLGIWGDPALTGKPIYSDLRRRKKTLPLVAAMASGTEAGDRLAAQYHQDGPLSDPELARLAERAGGRAWCQRRARELVASALSQLRAAVGAHRAADELAALAHLAVSRDH